RRTTGCVRTYAASGHSGAVVAAAEAAGMEVLLGVWIQRNGEENVREIDAALALAERHPRTIRALVVGNEVLLRREMSGERLVAILRSVKSRTSVPITYADMTEWWLKNPAVAEA